MESMRVNDGDLRSEVVTGEMQVGIVGSQNRTKGICGGFEGTDESLRTHIEIKEQTRSPWNPGKNWRKTGRSHGDPGKSRGDEVRGLGTREERSPL